MADTLKVKRVNTLPGITEASTLYIVKGSNPADAEIYFTAKDGLSIRKILDRDTVLALIAEATPNTGVTPGTYTKVTVDAKGRATAGFSLSSEDIPDNAANTTGTAAKATILETARTINGVSFNGSSNITINAVDITPRIAVSEKAVANGVATLGADGKVPDAQMHDILLMYSSSSAFPGTGLYNRIYVAVNTTYIYRWNGSGYTRLASSLL